MTAIMAASGYLPPQVVALEECLAAEGLAPGEIAFHRRIFGNREVRRAPGVSWVDLAVAATDGLDALRGRERDVRYLVHARTMTVGAHGAAPLRDLRGKLGLDRAHTFSVSQQACASGLLAVDVCGRLLAADGDPDALALVVAGEKTFSRVTRLMGPAVMAEGMAAVLVGTGPVGGGDPLLGYASRTHGEFNDPLGTPADLQDKFVEMSGVCMAEAIDTALDRAGLTPADVTLLLPHNINRTALTKVAHSLGIAEERVFFDHLVSVGHSFCADAFLARHAAVEQGRLRPGDHYVLTALGAGATWAAMVFRHGTGPTGPAVPSPDLRPDGTDEQEVPQ